MKKTIRNIGIVLFVIYGILLVVPSLHYYFWGDQTEQVIPFTIAYYRMVKSGQLGWWNWEMGLGGSNMINFLTVFGSPSFWTFLLLPSEKYIFAWYAIPDILRFLLTGIFSYLWLSKLVESKKARMVGSMMMAFSAWSIFFMHYFNFSDAFMYIPLMLYGIELYIQDNKRWVFPLSIFLMTILYIYAIYMASWLILIYVICRFTMLGKKIISKDLASLFISYVLGIGLAAFVFIPCVYVILQSSRVSGNIPSLLSDLSNLFVSWQGLYRNIASIFSPVINDFDYVIYSSPFNDMDFHTYALFIYSFIIFPLLFPQMFKVEFKGRKSIIWVLVFLSICSLIPIMYVVFNGNIQSRWGYYFTIFNVLSVVYLIEHQDSWDMALLKKSCVGVVLILVCLSVAAFVFKLTSESNMISILEIVPVLILLCFGYTLSFTNKEKEKLLSVCLVVEAMLCLTARMINGKSIIIGRGERAEEYETALLDTSTIDYVKSIDQGFYRISNDEETAANYNLPLAKNYKSHTYYFGVHNGPLDAYIDKRISGNWYLRYSPSKFMSLNLFGNKYWIANQEDSFVPYGYKKVHEMSTSYSDDVVIYEGPMDIGLGYGSTNTYALSSTEQLDKSFQEYIMMKGILVEEGTSYKDDHNFEYLGKIKDGVLEVNITEPGYIFFDYSQSLPSSVCAYEYYKDGKALNYDTFDEYGYHSEPIEQEVDGIGVYCENYMFEAEKVDVNVYFLSYENLQRIYDSYSEVDKFYDIKEDHGNVRAKIDVSQDEMIATTIPYNKGWQVFVDGKEIEKQCVNMSFVGFPLEKGTHEVEFVFTPQGYNLGKIISGISAILIIALFVINKRISSSN